MRSSRPGPSRRHGIAPTPPSECEDAGAGGVTLTRVIPLSDEKAVLYVQEPGAHLGRRAEHLVVTLDGRQTNRIPMASLRQVVIFGNVQVSTQVLHMLAEQEIPVSYLTGYGKFVATVMPPPPKNVACARTSIGPSANLRSRSGCRGRSLPRRLPIRGPC